MSITKIMLFNTDSLLNKNTKLAPTLQLKSDIEQCGFQVQLLSQLAWSDKPSISSRVNSECQRMQNEADLLLIPIFCETLYRHPLLLNWPKNIGKSIPIVFFIACKIPEKTPKIFDYCDDIIISERPGAIDLPSIHNALKALTEKQNESIHPQQRKKFKELNFVGESNAYNHLLLKVIKVSCCEVPVLIQGETGTGKEMVARAVHYFSNRKTHGFLPINCAALPDTLFESELFGYEKGAFTSANQRHAGLVELANNGTLFLDEVDSLSEKAQSALLRFLQTGEYRSVGGTKIKYANTRILAATNANLEAKVASGHFRQDLMFRLNVLNITIPPLRERLSDINAIAPHLLTIFAKSYGKGRKLLHPSYLEWLKSRSWPGNVRELVNFLLSEYFLNEGTLLKAPSGSFAQPNTPNARTPLKVVNEALMAMPYQMAKDKILQEFNQAYINYALKRSGGNITLAAEYAGKERRAFGKLVKRYDVAK